MVESGRRSFISRFALRCALWVLAIVAPAGIILSIAGLGVEIWTVLFFAILGSIITYVVCTMMSRRRFALAQTQLRRLRQQTFGELESVDAEVDDELDEINWHIYRSGISLEKELSELRKAANYRREFLGDVSHELKTPIFAIRGLAETLRDGALDDPNVNRSFVEKIIRNAERLDMLARDLAEISRMESGGIKMEFEPISLPHLISEIVESLEYKAKECGIRLVQNVEAGLPQVVADRARMRQVLSNLADNAIKYNREGGTAEVLASRAGGGVRVAVRDDGIGVAAADVPRLTERFYRVERSRSRGEGGTGLGLAIVKHILAAHQTQLQIDSELGTGSTFAFTFPASAVVGDTARTVSVPEKGASA